MKIKFKYEYDSSRFNQKTGTGITTEVVYINDVCFHLHTQIDGVGGSIMTEAINKANASEREAAWEIADLCGIRWSELMKRKELEVEITDKNKIKRIKQLLLSGVLK